MSFPRQPTRMIHKKLRSPLDECCPNPRRLAATEKPSKLASSLVIGSLQKTLSRTVPPIARVPSQDFGDPFQNLGPILRGQRRRLLPPPSSIRGWPGVGARPIRDVYSRPPHLLG